MLRKQTILGIGITDASEQEVLKYVFDVIKKGREKCFIATPNPEMIVYAKYHEDFKSRLNSADIAICDGIGLLIAGKVLGRPIKERITGTDLIGKLCEKAAEQAVTVGLLGGREGVAEKAAECLRKKYPELKVVFAASEFSILNSQLSILFVAFGHPKQEEWISSHLAELPVRVAMGVGGAFDYISGNVPRAPQFVRSVGLEWLYRLIHQPWRWKRQLALVEFLWMVLVERIKTFPSPGRRG